tara:strand:- start:1495 stop:1680 length:186 start_codon:yes stop_codon:yes gene_type:complete
MNNEKNNKNIDSAIKYINLAIKDYDKFLIEIDKLPEKEKQEILLWLRNALKYVNKDIERKK